MGSLRCKSWEFEKWCLLCEKLHNLGFTVWIFCAPDEREFIQRKFNRILTREGIAIKADPFGVFFDTLSKVDLLIGLDSFSVHAAHACKVPGIMLSGSNDYRIWQPPNYRVVHKMGSCNHYPCYNKPKCEAKDYEYN